FVVYSEYTADYQVGALVMQRYDFASSGSLTISITNKILYRWANQGVTNSLGLEPALNPTVVVDTGVSCVDPINNPAGCFQDPRTGEPQGSPFVDPVKGIGVVYVAWNSNYAPPTPPPSGFNPNSIKLIASADGGANFSTEKYLNTNTNSGAKMGSP